MFVRLLAYYFKIVLKKLWTTLSGFEAAFKLDYRAWSLYKINLLKYLLILTIKNNEKKYCKSIN